MILNVSYEKGSVIQALRYHFISRPELRIMLIAVNVFAVFSIVLYAFGKIPALPFLISSLLWFVLMISFWFLLPGLIYRQTSMFKHAFEMQFNNEGFSLHHANGSKSWQWNQLKNYVESPHFFHLYFDARSFFLIPKNSCKGDADLLELRKLIQSNLSKA